MLLFATAGTFLAFTARLFGAFGALCAFHSLGAFRPFCPFRTLRALATTVAGCLTPVLLAAAALIATGSALLALFVAAVASFVAGLTIAAFGTLAARFGAFTTRRLLMTSPATRAAIRGTAVGIAALATFASRVLASALAVLAATASAAVAAPVFLFTMGASGHGFRFAATPQTSQIVNVHYVQQLFQKRK
ncbi:hypothetical protein P3G55_24670 [Leptospira sp. 96542]|nr:hypothetical protein [Leptospira sp. 96542]